MTQECKATHLEKDLEQYVLELMNGERKGLQLQPLTRESHLDNGARCHTQEWRRVGDCNVDPAGEGHQCPQELSVQKRIEAAWAQYKPEIPRWQYENAGRRQWIPNPGYNALIKQIHDIWISTEPARPPSQIDVPHNHHEAIIYPLFRYVGIGVAVHDPTSTVRFTVDFVQPQLVNSVKSEQVLRPRVSNRREE